jgi:hypothetical protein
MLRLFACPEINFKMRALREISNYIIYAFQAYIYTINDTVLEAGVTAFWSVEKFSIHNLV